MNEPVCSDRPDGIMAFVLTVVGINIYGCLFDFKVDIEDDGQFGMFLFLIFFVWLPHFFVLIGRDADYNEKFIATVLVLYVFVPLVAIFIKDWSPDISVSDIKGTNYIIIEEKSKLGVDVYGNFLDKTRSIDDLIYIKKEDVYIKLSSKKDFDDIKETVELVHELNMANKGAWATCYNSYITFTGRLKKQETDRFGVSTINVLEVNKYLLNKEPMGVPMTSGFTNDLVYGDSYQCP